MDSLRDSVRASLGDAYVVERELTGGMSCVFVAHDRALDRRVVVKVLHPQLAASVSVERFRREILTVAGLQHPHIVGVLSTGNADGLPFFVMPYVEGESLAERLRRGPLSVRETVAVLKDVARALVFAHKRGIVHRDIKPGNILLAGSSAVVTDFGVAKALASARRSTPDGDWQLTTQGGALGTLLYMAPEQAAADPDIDGRADLYSLAVTAYEMLAGSPPFANLSARAMLAARMSTTPPSLASKRSDVPAVLDDLLTRCLAPDPADRPRSAQELLDALDTPEMMSDRFPVRPPSKPRRWPVALGVAAASLGLVGALFGGYTRATDRAAHRAPSAVPLAVTRSRVAVMPFVDLGSGTAGAELATGITNAVAGDLAKSGALRVISPSAAALLVQHLHGASSPPGNSVADLVLEGTIQRDGGRVRVTARLSNASDGVMRWADVYDRDSRDVFAVTDDIAVAIVASVSHSTG